MNLCKLCLKEKVLVKSHIIPQSFHETGNVLISMENAHAKQRPIGTYDKNILCAECESYLNTHYDNDAKKILLDKKHVIKTNVTENGKTITFYQLANAQYDKIEKFFISILWRASVSTHPDFKNFNLGPYEERAKQSITDLYYPYNKYFNVALLCLKDLVKLQLFPMIRNKIEDVNFYTIIVGSIKAFIQVDKRKTPKSLEHVILKRKNILMLEGELQNINEYQSLLLLAKKYLA